MKTSSDPRHRRRIKIIQRLFSSDFQKKPDATVKFIWRKLKVIDPLISAAAPQWPTDKLNHIDLAILRLAVYELVIDKKQPYKVIIDEAVELAKTFGSSNAPDFVNGVLGNIIEKTSHPQT